MTNCPTPKPMPVTSLPDRGSASEPMVSNGAILGKMQVTNGRPPKGGK